MSDGEKVAVEHVLKALGQADTPAGMERRILARLEQPDAAASETHWWSRWLAGGLAFAALLATVIAIPRTIRSRDVVPVAKKDTAMPPPLLEVVAHELETKPVRSLSARRVAVVGLDRSESPMAEEMRAKSFPAPPMPLTEEEQLLLQIAHRGDRTGYALLRPEMQAANEADERAEFKDFFMEPPFLITPKIDNNQ